jgi:hypothetical protein
VRASSSNCVITTSIFIHDEYTNVPTMTTQLLYG